MSEAVFLHSAILPDCRIPQFRWIRQRYVSSCLEFKHFHTRESSLGRITSSFRILAKVRAGIKRCQRPPACPFGDCLSKRGAFAAFSCCDRNDLAKFPCSAASSLCPASGGSRQPLDRQIRYYSEWTQVASRDFGTSVPYALRKISSNAEAPLPHGVAPRLLQLVTGL